MKTFVFGQETVSKQPTLSVPAEVTSHPIEYKTQTKYFSTDTATENVFDNFSDPGDKYINEDANLSIYSSI
jgi:hypothetical protein